MKEELEKLLEYLRDEQLEQLREKISLVGKYKNFETERKLTLISVVNIFLPNTEKNTLKHLSSKIPNFDIPMTYSFFGLIKDFDIYQDLEVLKNKLFNYLYTSNFIPEPYGKELSSIDSKLKCLKEKKIRSTEIKIETITEKIYIIEDLLKLDLEKVNLSTYEKVKQAIILQNEIIRKYGISYYNNELFLHNRNNKILDIMIEPNLLELWLWNELSYQNSDFNKEIQIIKPKDEKISNCMDLDMLEINLDDFF